MRRGLSAPGVERRRVPGGGALLLDLGAGDRLEIADPEGAQPALLASFDAAGASAPGLFGAPGPRARLDAAPAGGDRLRAACLRRGIDLTRADAAAVFGAESPPGATASFTATEAGVALIVAPGGAMAPDAQTPPTELRVVVTRAAAGPSFRRRPTEPLADAMLDIRIDPGRAIAYEVPKGGWIQILDVQGRECSDFQAFSRRALDRGRPREIDPTATRSMTGGLYPAPGLGAKFFSQDLEPLVEVVRDTCGRHDMFGLACTARYYAAMGYPGHVNCSDNLNLQAAPWSIPEREGWPAVNFFYNTALDEALQIGLDEPWSRPGDYVLLRAMTDLVCFSTACPSDIDATNGFDPTEIQVRVHGPQERFSRATAWRKTPDAEPEMTKETGFHPRTSALTESFAAYNGFWLPSVFPGEGAVGEYWACRERAALIDLSALRKVEVIGPDAENLLQLCLTRDVRRLSVGQVSYSALCFEHGGMIDDGTLARLGPDNFRWICGADDSALHLRETAGAHGLDAWVKTSTDQLCNVALQGPLSRDILKAVLWTPPDRPAADSLGWFRFTVGRIAGWEGPAVVVSRTGYTGELGYELFCHPRDAEAVWDALREAGAPHGLAAMGLEALDMLRIEAGLVAAGAEFCSRTDPFEAGIGFAVSLKTPDDFIGRAALEARKAHPQRRLIGLRLGGGRIPGRGDGVFTGRAQVGEITSATRSPSLGGVIALARVDVAAAGPFEVGRLDGFMERAPAETAPFPFYDPEKTRVRA
ncbi:aminomethyltransferase [Rubrimonas cliftonensis]|uniref:Aminomethyltransferase n=1 Tax=Rubrimonas cliftonensis TaxID=89524 RepID=A0A1H4CE44_9RHOB|nr:aminomethyltransferase [Rubrimonas cliftonensis]